MVFKKGDAQTRTIAEKGRNTLKETSGFTPVRNFGVEGGVNPAEAAAKNANFPKVLVPESNFAARPVFTSFAKKIRHQTRDGWELIEAVYEVFVRARASQKDELVIEAATWLADRGFGKPVQVTALTDSEGQPLAFTLWQPAVDGVLPPPAPSRQDVEDARIIDMEPPKAAVPLSAPSNDETPAPIPLEIQESPDDGYVHGVARPWSKWDKDPKPGE